MRRRTLIRDGETALEFAVDAYVYLYPLVLLDLMRRQATCVSRADEAHGRAPVNSFAHASCPLSTGYHDLVRPAFDTLLSFAWLNVAREPVVVSVPDAGDGYYLLPMLDAWSDLVAVPGTRTAGNWPAVYAVVEHGWQGVLPERARLIEAPTPFVWILGRTAPTGRAEDFRRSLTVTPLSRWGRHRPQLRLHVHYGRRRPDPAVDPVTPAVEQVDAMEAPDFFTRGAELLGVNPPHVHDHAVLQRIERIGIVPGEPFRLRTVPRAVAEALPAAAARARFEIHQRSRRLGWARNGWQVCCGTMGAWGTDYLKRAAVARTLPGAAMPEDVVHASAHCDHTGRPLDGGQSYRLRFPAHEHPPAQALWSLTAYDERGYAVPNTIGRYVLGSGDELAPGADGTVELTVQHSPPRAGSAANWLPCPPGRFDLWLRLYRPEREVLEYAWAPPSVERLEAPTRAPAAARASEAVRS